MCVRARERALVFVYMSVCLRASGSPTSQPSIALAGRCGQPSKVALPCPGEGQHPWRRGHKAPHSTLSRGSRRSSCLRVHWAEKGLKAAHLGCGRGCTPVTTPEGKGPVPHSGGSGKDKRRSSLPGLKILVPMATVCKAARGGGVARQWEAGGGAGEAARSGAPSYGQDGCSTRPQPAAWGN